jgi:hypothetical protein
MEQDNEVTLTPDFLRTQIKIMADMQLSEQTASMIGLFSGLISTMNMLQPEGYCAIVPAPTFHPVKE